MIKKYKIACCVLGAIVLVLILALAITVFVFAGNIKAADGVENASGDIADTISEAVFLTTSYVRLFNLARTPFSSKKHSFIL